MLYRHLTLTWKADGEVRFHDSDWHRRFENVRCSISTRKNLSVVTGLPVDNDLCKLTGCPLTDPDWKRVKTRGRAFVGTGHFLFCLTIRCSEYLDVAALDIRSVSYYKTTLEFLYMAPSYVCQRRAGMFLDMFIHYRHLYSASSRGLLRGAPNYSTTK